MIEGVELTVYLDDDEMITFDLSAAQTELVLTALGITIHDTTYSHYPDATCRQITAHLRRSLTAQKPKK